MSSGSLEKLNHDMVRGTDLPEIGIGDSVSLEHIKVIAVPEDKVEYVRKLVGDTEIIVTPINLEGRFYNIELDGWSNVHFYDEKAKQLVEGRTQATTTSFNSEEVIEVSETRTVSGIESIYEQIKETIQEENNGKESRIE